MRIFKMVKWFLFVYIMDVKYYKQESDCHACQHFFLVSLLFPVERNNNIISSQNSTTRQYKYTMKQYILL